MGKLENRVVVVTGGALGIGRATAIAAAKEGAKVAICDINDNEGEKVVNEIKKSGSLAKYYHMDVSKEKEVQNVFEKIEKDLGPIFGLVNNAGIGGVTKPTHEITETEWDSVFNVNVKGVFFCTKHAIPSMLKLGKGSIVNLSSVAGIVGSRDFPPYSASKGAVRIMTKVDALIYASQGIRVNSVHPYFVDTLMVTDYAEKKGNKDAVYKSLASLNPLKRLGKPEEIAAVIIFLLSDDSSYMTGSELIVDGGFTAQ